VRDRFRDRAAAGVELGERLAAGAAGSLAGAVVVGLPRGGVEVAAAVARRLGAPLDILVVRKLGVRGHAELAMGAIAGGDERVLNDDVVEMLGITDEEIETVTAAERAEVARRERAYRGERPALDLHGRAVVLVDDGLATGSTMRVATIAARRLGAARVVVAVPAAAPEAVSRLAAEADEVVALVTPAAFGAVGLWYDDFTQTSDATVRAVLARGAAPTT